MLSHSHVRTTPVSSVKVPTPSLHTTGAEVGDLVGTGVTGLRLGFAEGLILLVGRCEGSSLGSPLGNREG